ncbi:MAG: twin-arginine translocase TatA/TatE family subunit [Dehalococcoidia bacterium]|jgi:Tat protein translocase TatB subunit
MEFFGVGLPELVLILVLTLIVVGPQRLPEVAAQLGKAIRELRRYTSGINKDLLDAVADLEREYKELKGELRSVSGEMLQKAESLGRELTDVSDEVRKQLKVESPQAKAPAESKQAGGNGASTDGSAPPPVQETTDGIAGGAIPTQEGG